MIQNVWFWIAIGVLLVAVIVIFGSTLLVYMRSRRNKPQSKE